MELRYIFALIMMGVNGQTSDIPEENFPTAASKLSINVNSEVEDLEFETGFPTIVTEKYYIDKTELIEVLMGKNKPSDRIVLTMPRRFGKTVNIQMVRSFFQDVSHNEQLLQQTDKMFNTRPLNIMKNTHFVAKHFRKYPVIYIDLAINLQGTSKTLLNTEMLLGLIVKKCIRVMSEYQWLYIQYYKNKDNSTLTATQMEIKKAFELLLYCEQTHSGYLNLLKTDNDFTIFISWLYSLGEALRLHYRRRTMLLVDEFDSPASNAMIYNLNISAVNDLLSRVWFDALKTVPCPFHFTFMTGITGIVKSLGLSAIGFRHLPFLDENYLNKFYGFHEDEMSALFERYNITCNEEKSLIASYFDGYVTKRAKFNFYNPESVVTFLNKRGVTTGKHDITEVRDLLYESSGWTKSSSIITKLQPKLKHPKIHNLFLDACLYNRSIQFKYIRDLSVETWNALSNLESYLFTRNSDSVIQSENAYFSFLMQTGYLSNDREKRGWYKIPNKEIQNYMHTYLHGYYVDHDYQTMLSAAKAVDKLKQIAEENVSEKLIDETKSSLELLFKNHVFLNKRNQTAIFKEAHFQFSMYLALQAYQTFSYTNIEENLGKNDRTGEVDILIITEDLRTVLIIELKRDASREKFANTLTNQLMKYSLDTPKSNFIINVLECETRVKYLLINVHTKGGRGGGVDLAYDPGQIYNKKYKNKTKCSKEAQFCVYCTIKRDKNKLTTEN